MELFIKSVMVAQPNAGYLATPSRTELSQQFKSLVEAQFTLEQQKLLQETTQSIQRQAKRRFSEDYAIGKQLLTIKSFFPHGQRRLFVYWASQITGLGESMADRVQRIARAFMPFEETGQFHLLDRVSAASLDRIAGHSITRKARTAFFQLILEEQTPTESEVIALIEAHQNSEDITESEQFIRYSTHVSLWGTLRICEDGDEEFKFYLVDRNGIAHYLKHYKDLMTQYKAWRDRYMQEQFSQVQNLISPHWRIRSYPCPSLPYRVTVDCELPNRHLSYTIGNPIAVESWWYERAQQWTAEQIENQSAIQVKASSVSEATSTTSVEFNSQWLPCCKNCDWHDSRHESNTEGWIYCGFYGQPMQQERMYDMPLHCRKWRHPNAPPPTTKLKSEPIPHLDSTHTAADYSNRVDINPTVSSTSNLPQAELHPDLTLQEVKRFLLEAEVSDRDLDELEAIISQLKTTRTRRKTPSRR